MDCCAVCYEFSSGKFLMSERCRRALVYGVNVLQSRFDSATYAYRLEKYACRYGFAVGFPGFQPQYLGRMPDAIAGYLHVMDYDLLLELGERRGFGEVTVAFADRRETVTHTSAQMGKVVSGSKRMVTFGLEHGAVRLRRAKTPEVECCPTCGTMTVALDSLTHSVVVVPLGFGCYDVLEGIASLSACGSACCRALVNGERTFSPSIGDNLAGYSSTPIALAFDVSEHCMKQTLQIDPSTKWIDGGAVSKLGRLMATQNGECSVQFCANHVSNAVTSGQPLTFVFDFVSAISEFDNLRCILDARHVPVLNPGLSEHDFQKTYCLPRKLAFDEVQPRKVVAINWFDGVHAPSLTSS